MFRLRLLRPSGWGRRVRFAARAALAAGAVCIPGVSCAAAGLESGGAAVVVVASAGMPESLAIARYYCERRGIAGENIVLLETSASESVSADEFRASIREPLRLWLARAALRPRFLVLVRGVPVVVRPEAGTQPGPMNRTECSVDSELALLLCSDAGTAGPLRNPLCADRNQDHPGAQPVLITARLDGPDEASVRRLIDQALLAERDGAWGRAYVDMGGPYPLGDAWLRRAADLIEEAGFPVMRDARDGVFEAFERFDRPILYLGWYRSNLEGVFLRPGFTFPPGAMALHIHSYSAAPVRSREKAWVGPFVARGVTATFGNVDEPYLQFTHRPDLLIERLLAGDCMGEAAVRSVTALSWQGVFLGDPLFRPFPGGRAALLDRARRSEDPYAAVVAAKLLSAGAPEEARALLRTRWEATRHPIVAMAFLECAEERSVAEAAGWVCEADWAATAGEPALLGEAIDLLRRRSLDDAAGRLTLMRRRGF